MNYTYYTKGTCSKQIDLEINGDVITNVKFYGGCDAGSTYTKCVILNEDGKIVADVTKRSFHILLEQVMDVIRYHLLMRIYQR